MSTTLSTAGATTANAKPRMPRLVLLITTVSLTPPPKPRAA
jgi:hypothetical protein